MLGVSRDGFLGQRGASRETGAGLGPRAPAADRPDRRASLGSLNEIITFSAVQARLTRPPRLASGGFSGIFLPLRRFEAPLGGRAMLRWGAKYAWSGSRLNPNGKSRFREMVKLPAACMKPGASWMCSVLFRELPCLSFECCLQTPEDKLSILDALKENHQ